MYVFVLSLVVHVIEVLANGMIRVDTSMKQCEFQHECIDIT